MRITITIITPNNFHFTQGEKNWKDIIFPQEAAQSSTVRGAAFAQLIKVGLPDLEKHVFFCKKTLYQQVEVHGSSFRVQNTIFFVR